MFQSLKKYDISVCPLKGLVHFYEYWFSSIYFIDMFFHKFGMYNSPHISQTKHIDMPHASLTGSHSEGQLHSPHLAANIHHETGAAPHGPRTVLATPFIWGKTAGIGMSWAIRSPRNMPIAAAFPQNRKTYKNMSPRSDESKNSTGSINGKQQQCQWRYKGKTYKYRLKRKEKNKSREEIFYQMKVFFVKITCKFL